MGNGRGIYPRAGAEEDDRAISSERPNRIILSGDRVKRRRNNPEYDALAVDQQQKDPPCFVRSNRSPPKTTRRIGTVRCGYDYPIANGPFRPVRNKRTRPPESAERNGPLCSVRNKRETIEIQDTRIIAGVETMGELTEMGEKNKKLTLGQPLQKTQQYATSEWRIFHHAEDQNRIMAT